MGPFTPSRFFGAFVPDIPRCRSSLRSATAPPSNRGYGVIKRMSAYSLMRGPMDGLSVKSLGREEIGLFVGAEHPWAKRNSIAMAELHGVDMIRREQGSRTRDAFERACRFGRRFSAYRDGAWESGGGSRSGGGWSWSWRCEFCRSGA